MKRAKYRTQRRAPRRTKDWRDIFRDRLREAVVPLGDSNRERAERLELSDSSRLSEWLSGRVLPNAETLQRIAVATGASVDWLLGFDVPRDRSARTAVGAVGDALRAALLDDVLSVVLPEDRQLVEEMSAADVMQASVDAWWQQRAEIRRRQLRKRFSRLADMMEGSAEQAKHARIRSRLLHAADDARRHAWELKRVTLARTLPDSARLEAEEQLELPYAVPFGTGFAYRGVKADHAWYLHPGTLEPTYRHHGRFLRERGTLPVIQTEVAERL